MDTRAIAEQSEQLEDLLPALMLRLFPVDPTHPLGELPLGQIRLCRMLQGTPRTASSIARELACSVSAATQIADRLERTGLVDREPGPDDRRTKLLRLTAYGEEAMAVRRRRRTHRIEQVLARMADSDRADVIRAITTLTNAANEQAAVGATNDTNHEEAP